MYEALASQSQTLPLLTPAFPQAGSSQSLVRHTLHTSCTHPAHQLLLRSPQQLQGPGTNTSLARDTTHGFELSHRGSTCAPWVCSACQKQPLPADCRFLCNALLPQFGVSAKKEAASQFSDARRHYEVKAPPFRRVTEPLIPSLLTTS